MKLNYDPREIFYGNEALVVADVAKGANGKIETSNIKLVTGLVSVGAMEDQAETTNYPADDVPDHGFKKGATLLQGSMTFIQTSQALREDLMGWVATDNGLGYSPTGNFKTKLVQYLIKGKRRNMDTGTVEEGWRVVIYPQLTPTAEATNESETDSVDGVDPIQWEVAVQATASDIYTNKGYKVPQIEFTIWGEQAKAYEKKMEEELFILLPDTVIAGGAPEATSVTLNKTTTSIKVGANETLTATVTPDEASQTVTWASSDDTKATVDASGKVTAVAEGTATITAKTANDKSATCTVTVTSA